MDIPMQIIKQYKPYKISNNLFNIGSQDTINSMERAIITISCDNSTVDLAAPKSWATFYNLEMVIALAFRLNTNETSRIRQKVLESLTQRKMEALKLLFALEWQKQQFLLYRAKQLAMSLQ